MYKILHIIPATSVKWGGPVTTMANLIRVWKELGYDSAILTLNVRDTKVVEIDSEVFAFEASWPARYSRSLKALRWVKENHQGYDLFIIHGIWSILNIEIGRYLAKAHRPYCVIPHGSLDPFDLQKKALIKKVLGPYIVKPYLNMSRGVICSTALEAERLVVYRSDVRKFVVPWPVEPGIRMCSEGKIYRREMGIRDDEFVLLFFGRVDYKKGFPVLIPAFKEVTILFPRTRLLIVGPDSRGYLKKVRAIIEREGVSNHITFGDAVSGQCKSKVFHAADCFVLTSLNENFGNAVVEAMQEGLPVIISDNVYIADTVKANGAGIVCTYDVASVKAAIVKLITDANMRSLMGQNAERLGKQYSLGSLKSAYKELINCLRKGN